MRTEGVARFEEFPDDGNVVKSNDDPGVEEEAGSTIPLDDSGLLLSR